MYRSLNARSIVETVEAICKRIEERFPDSGLGRVSRELLHVGQRSVTRTEWLRKPVWPLRIAIWIAMACIVSAIVGAAYAIRVSPAFEGFSDFLQAIEAAVNEIILLALALYFLSSLETRMKRAKALHALHEIRSLCHVIDMHQLTKDPEATVLPALLTPSSPRDRLTPFLLTRYLDYCSELLSLASKLAALHVQHLPDPVLLDAVNDVETLAGGLSQKIWQKISVMEMKLQRGSDTSSNPK